MGDVVRVQEYIQWEMLYVYRSIYNGRCCTCTGVYTMEDVVRVQEYIEWEMLYVYKCNTYIVRCCTCTGVHTLGDDVRGKVYIHWVLYVYRCTYIGYVVHVQVYIHWDMLYTYRCIYIEVCCTRTGVHTLGYVQDDDDAAVRR